MKTPSTHVTWATVLATVLMAGCASASVPSPVATGAGTATSVAVATASPAAAAPCATPTAQPGGEVVASTASIPTGSLPKVRFIPAGAPAVTLPLEVPPSCEYGIGLSGRTSLSDRGMLFYFPEPAEVPFWMVGTHIDLDIAFVDQGLTVLAVETMKAETRDYHRPATPYIAAIEAPAGWYAEHGVGAGATVVFDFDLKAATGR